MVDFFLKIVCFYIFLIVEIGSLLEIFLVKCQNILERCFKKFVLIIEDVELVLILNSRYFYILVVDDSFIYFIMLNFLVLVIGYLCIFG